MDDALRCRQRILQDRRSLYFSLERSALSYAAAIAIYKLHEMMRYYKIGDRTDNNTFSMGFGTLIGWNQFAEKA